MTQFHFLGQVPWLVALLVAALAAGLCFVLYRRDLSIAGSSRASWLPWLRSLAVGLVVLMLTEPTLQHRIRQGEPGQLAILIDDSASMSLKDGQPVSRYQRAVDGLLNTENQLLSRLADDHEVRVLRGSSNPTIELWSATIEHRDELPKSFHAWSTNQFRSTTQIGDVLAQEKAPVVVVLTDGQVNQGLSLLEAIAKVDGQPRSKIFPVGFGARDRFAEATIIQVEHPDRLFRRDRLTGKVTIRDTLPKGTAYRIQAQQFGELVWEQTMIADGSEQRVVALSLPMEPLVQRYLGNQKQDDHQALNEVRTAIPLALDFRVQQDSIPDSLISTQTASQNRDDTSYSIRLWAALHRARILLIDSRSRWETRYLKNVFERDPFWEISVIIAEPDDLFGNSLHLPIEPTRSLFPKDRDELMQYDLIILGDLKASLLSKEQQEWLVDFVSESGGGLVIIDGQREGWLDDSQSPLQTLLPVKHQSKTTSENHAHRVRVRLTSAGSKLAALDIRSHEQELLSTVWEQLPAMRWAASVSTLPGSETLAEWIAESDEPIDAKPLFVTRRLGAGRIFYAASDESWRWRYKVADTVHQRFWNQLARWIMRIPFVSESETLSLDAGMMNYQQGQAVQIRCRVRKNPTTPVTNANVQAIVGRQGEPPIMVAMIPDPQIPGFYQGNINQLPPGDYEVSISASGVPKELLNMTTSFRVLAAPSVELNEKSINVMGLQQLAERSGGRLLFEDELPRLVDELQPLSRGKIIESETLLWQSYYWFVPIVILLTIEWWLRKSVGLT